MLVLSRKLNESIVIGDDITITVTRIGTYQVRLGIDAPAEMLIRRSELVADRVRVAMAEGRLDEFQDDMDREEG